MEDTIIHCEIRVYEKKKQKRIMIECIIVGCFVGYKVGEIISDEIQEANYKKYKKEMINKLSKYFNKDIIMFVDMRRQLMINEIRYSIKGENNYHILDSKIFDNL